MSHPWLNKHESQVTLLSTIDGCLHVADNMLARCSKHGFQATGIGEV